MMKTNDDNSVKLVRMKKKPVFQPKMDFFKLDTMSHFIQFKEFLKSLTSKDRHNIRHSKKMVKYRKMLETLPLSLRQSDFSETLPFVPYWSYQNRRTAPPASPLVKSEPGWSYQNRRTAPPASPLVKSEPGWSYQDPRTAPLASPLVKSEPGWSYQDPRTAPPASQLVKSEPGWSYQDPRTAPPASPLVKSEPGWSYQDPRTVPPASPLVKSEPGWNYQDPRTAPLTSPLVKSEPESSIAVPVVPNWGHQNRPTRIIQLSYPNILNDNAEDTKKTGLRPVIIDGCNVGFGYGKGDFVMRGLILVIEYFKNRGHDEIMCFLPQRYRHRVRSPCEDRTVCSLEKEDTFSFTPSRNLVNGKKYTPCDDRFIVQYAAERQGVIISNDGYRDLIEEEPSWKETIEKRIINYIFVRDIFMLSIDPLGPAGPKLDEILKFPSE